MFIIVEKNEDGLDAFLHSFWWNRWYYIYGINYHKAMFYKPYEISLYWYDKLSGWTKASYRTRCDPSHVPKATSVHILVYSCQMHMHARHLGRIVPASNTGQLRGRERGWDQSIISYTLLRIRYCWHFLQAQSYVIIYKEREKMRYEVFEQATSANFMLSKRSY